MATSNEHLPGANVRRSAMGVGLPLSTPHAVMLAETTLDIVGFCDAGGSFLYLNKAGRVAVGLSDYDPLAPKATHYLDPDDSEIIERDVLPQVLADGSWSGRMRLINFALDRSFTAAGTACACRTRDGRFLGTIFVLRQDEGSSGAADQQRILEASALKAVYAEVAAAAHDINNLTSSVLLSLAILNETTDASKARHAIALCRKAADQTTEVLEKLMRSFDGRNLEDDESQPLL